MLKAYDIMKKITNLQKDLKEHQEKCHHKKAVFYYGKNSGHLSEVDDFYWASIFCPTCLRIFTIFSDKDPVQFKQLTKQYKMISKDEWLEEKDKILSKIF